MQEIIDDNQMMPREKLIAYGASSLTDAQVLAILLRTGTKRENVFAVSENVMKKYPKFKGFSDAKLVDLMEINGIGNSKALELCAAIELGRRIQRVKTLRFGTVTSSQKIGEEMVRYLRAENQEQLIGIFLDTKNQIIKQQMIYKGTLNSSVAHPREVLAIALSVNAARFVLVHNHPSGVTTPSKQDINFTNRIIECGELLGIQCLDHLIVGKDQYLSMQESGIFEG